MMDFELNASDANRFAFPSITQPNPKFNFTLCILNPLEYDVAHRLMRVSTESSMWAFH